MAISILAALSCVSARAQTIVTVAGGNGNDTTAAIYARIKTPSFIVFDGTSKLYFRDNIVGSNNTRILNTATGIIAQGPTGGGRGVFDASGNWYYATGSYQGYVYKRSPAGIATLIAGNGSATYSGDGGMATLAGLSANDVALDGAGNVYVSDYRNNRIRKVSPSGIISTVAGNGTPGFFGDGGNALLAYMREPTSIALDPAGNLYIADGTNARIRKVSTTGIITTIAGGGSVNGEGGPATSAMLQYPYSIRLDGTGNIFVSTAYKVQKINPSGIITTVAGLGTSGFTGDGGPATAAKFNYALDIAIDGAGNVFVADCNNHRIRKISTSGLITSVAGNGLAASGYGGDGGSPLLALFDGVYFVPDEAGNLFIADYNNNRIRKVSAAGITTTIAGDGTPTNFGDGGPASAATVEKPFGIVVDRSGNLFFSSYNGHLIRKITPSGIISTFAGGGGVPGEGGPATAAFVSTGGLAVDTAGNLFYVDVNYNLVRKVDAASGIVSTVAGGGTATGYGIPATSASLSQVWGIATDRRGNLFLGGPTTRKVDATGIIHALPFYSNGIATDTMGNLYAADAYVFRYDIYGYLQAMPGYPTGAMAIDMFGNFYTSSISGTGVGKICCLSTVIDRPPVFAYGAAASMAACGSSVANPINSLLSINDGDVGQTIQWSILSNPLHGSLSGFPTSITSTGGAITPSGLSYTPTPGYVGSDIFRIKVSDGTDTAMIQINVSIPALLPMSISGGTAVCIGDTVHLSASHAGGTWSTASSNATVSAGGVVTGVIAGTARITYTNSVPCFLSTVNRIVTVNQLPVVSINSAAATVCRGSVVYWSATPIGGEWVSSSPNATVDTSGMVWGESVGGAIISYSVTNSCGTVTDTGLIEVKPVPVLAAISGIFVGCPGETNALTSSVSGGTWSSSRLSIATVDATGAVALIAPGTARISYTISNSCGTKVATVNVTVNGAPSAGFLSGAVTACTGDTSALASSVPGGVWSSSDPLIAAIDSAGNIQSISTGIAIISYSVTDNCGTASVLANFEVRPVPVLTPIMGKSLIIKGKAVELRGRAPSGMWSTSDSSVAVVDPWGVTSGIGSGDATITYSETNSFGCSAYVTLLVNVTTRASIEFNAYPNPASRVLTIAYRKSAIKDADIQLTDIAGRIVYTGKLEMPASTGAQQYNVSGIPDGVYTLSIKSADGDFTGRVVIKE